MENIITQFFNGLYKMDLTGFAVVCACILVIVGICLLAFRPEKEYDEKAKSTGKDKDGNPIYPETDESESKRQNMLIGGIISTIFGIVLSAAAYKIYMDNRSGPGDVKTEEQIPISEDNQSSPDNVKTEEQIPISEKV
jgi:hypothetical protein